MIFFSLRWNIIVYVATLYFTNNSFSFYSTINDKVSTFTGEGGREARRVDVGRKAKTTRRERMSTRRSCGILRPA